MASVARTFSDRLAELEVIVASPGSGRANETSLAAAQQILLRMRASEDALDVHVMAVLGLIAARLPILYSARRHRDHEGGASGGRARTVADCRKVRARLLRLERQRSERGGS